jgi:hypothetical protein
MAVNVGAAGQLRASLGLDLTQSQPDKPAFWSILVLLLLLVVVIAIAHSLR